MYSGGVAGNVSLEVWSRNYALPFGFETKMSCNRDVIEVPRYIQMAGVTSIWRQQ